MESKFDSMVSFIFRSPKDAPKETDRNYSNLYLLRRDIFTCFGIDPNTGIKQEGYQALWPGVMAIMAGIDLLGKFSEGDSIGVGKRFKNYVNKYINAKIHEELYQLRCSLIHSFGLYSVDSKGRIFRFILDGSNSNGQLIEKSGNEMYKIDIFMLLLQFEKSIQCFEQFVRSDSYPSNRFIQMVEKYGAVRIGPAESFN